MPWNPKYDWFHYVKVALKYVKFTDFDQIIFSSESVQDTSARQIQVTSPIHCQGNIPKPQIYQFRQVKVALDEGESTHHRQDVISAESGQDTLAC